MEISLKGAIEELHECIELCNLTIKKSSVKPQSKALDFEPVHSIVRLGLNEIESSTGVARKYIIEELRQHVNSLVKPNDLKAFFGYEEEEEEETEHGKENNFSKSLSTLG
uniref:Uncharacterized protein n=1 Tax=Tanacetum cinerariifolium TaxID=118510 RepID=A0A6L2MV43_TANCI|nr:hypothetical protein [Tanacetum cinerariifolium]